MNDFAEYLKEVCWQRSDLHSYPLDIFLCLLLLVKFHKYFVLPLAAVGINLMG